MALTLVLGLCTAGGCHGTLTFREGDGGSYSRTYNGGVAGTDYVRSPVASFTPSRENTAYTIDITRLVQRWVDGASPFGLIVFRDHADVAAFYSDDHASIKSRPKLAVEFTARKQQ